MDSFDILVVILSVTLLVLLIASIVLVVSVLKLVKKLREITDTANEIMHDVEAVSDFFKKSTGTVAITTLLSNIVSKVTEFKGKKGKK